MREKIWGEVVYMYLCIPLVQFCFYFRFRDIFLPAVKAWGKNRKKAGKKPEKTQRKTQENPRDVYMYLCIQTAYIFEDVSGRRKSVVLNRESIGRANLSGVILSLLCRRFFIIVTLLLVTLLLVALSLVMLSLCRRASLGFISALFWFYSLLYPHYFGVFCRLGKAWGKLRGI